MGKCQTKIKKLLFVIEEELTQAYVAVEAVGDCPIGVQGWHHKTFSKSRNVMDLLKEEVPDHLTWPLNAPE